MGSIIVGTDTKNDSVVAARVEVCTFVETIPFACAVLRFCSLLANVQL